MDGEKSQAVGGCDQEEFTNRCTDKLKQIIYILVSCIAGWYG